MPLQPFTFAMKPDIRLIVYGNTVYKIKLNCRQSQDRNRVYKLCLEEKNHKDLERVICSIINSSNPQPVITDNFVVYPYKHYWETQDKLLFTRDGKRLKAHEFSYTFYVEERRTDRPTEKEQKEESAEVGSVERRVVSDYGQKNRHDIEEKDLKEFLRLQQMAGVIDTDQVVDEDAKHPVTGLQRVFNALVSPVKTLLGQH